MDILASRKFWAAIIGLLVVFFGDRAGLNQQQITDAVILIVTYIAGHALQTGLTDTNTNTVKK